MPKQTTVSVDEEIMEQYNFKGRVIIYWVMDSWDTGHTTEFVEDIDIMEMTLTDLNTGDTVEPDGQLYTQIYDLILDKAYDYLYEQGCEEDECDEDCCLDYDYDDFPGYDDNAARGDM